MLSGEIQILPIHKTYKDYNNNNPLESNIFKAYYHFIVDWGDGTSEQINIKGDNTTYWNTDETSIFSGYILGVEECLENNDIYHSILIADGGMRI